MQIIVQKPSSTSIQWNPNKINKNKTNELQKKKNGTFGGIWLPKNEFSEEEMKTETNQENSS